MLCFEDIRISIKSQGFEIKEFEFSPHEDQTVAIMESMRNTSEFVCPACKSPVYIYDTFQINIKDKQQTFLSVDGN